jgi:hypothetical protein
MKQISLWASRFINWLRALILAREIPSCCSSCEKDVTFLHSLLYCGIQAIC